MMGDRVVELRGLTKRFGGSVTAVDGLDLCVEAGETYRLLGPNGAGEIRTGRPARRPGRGRLSGKRA
jgi:ABC-type branched-subunit amino acid transport system ATPase component